MVGGLFTRSNAVTGSIKCCDIVDQMLGERWSNANKKAKKELRSHLKGNADQMNLQKKRGFNWSKS